MTDEPGGDDCPFSLFGWLICSMTNIGLLVLCYWLGGMTWGNMGHTDRSTMVLLSTVGVACGPFGTFVLFGATLLMLLVTFCETVARIG